MTHGMGRSKKETKSKDGSHIIDFNEARKTRLEAKSRKTERIFFKSLLSTYFLDTYGNLVPIEIIDISEEGCSFQLPVHPIEAHPKDSKNLPIRLYFSQDTYLEILLQIQNSRELIDNSARVIRFGCKVDENTKAYPAYKVFVKFLKLYSEQAHKDTGKSTLFYI